MSTRCNVIIKGSGKTTQFYRHYDGDPATVGSDLRDIHEDYGFDYDSFVRTLDRMSEYENEGHEIAVHGDIAYLYVVDTDAGTITSYKAGRDLDAYVTVVVENYTETVRII